ncbi:hypothetical protein PMAYCL1PPCAC_21531, partial [Pristionchus mayeri]
MPVLFDTTKTAVDIVNFGTTATKWSELLGYKRNDNAKVKVEMHINNFSSERISTDPIIIPWEIDDANTIFGSLSAEYIVSIQGGFKWTASIESSSQDCSVNSMTNFSLRCVADQHDPNEPWVCDALAEVRILKSDLTSHPPHFSIKQRLHFNNSTTWNDFDLDEEAPIPWSFLAPASMYHRGGKVSLEFHISIFSSER